MSKQAIPCLISAVINLTFNGPIYLVEFNMTHDSGFIIGIMKNFGKPLIERTQRGFQS